MPIHIKLSKIPSWILRVKKSVSFSHKFTVIINFCSLIFLSFFLLYSMLGIKPLSLRRVVCKKCKVWTFYLFSTFFPCVCGYFSFCGHTSFLEFALRRGSCIKFTVHFSVKEKKKKCFLPFQFCKNQVLSQCSCRPVVHPENNSE